jgi:hypothetical protein
MKTFMAGLATVLAFAIAAPAAGARPTLPEKGKVEGTILEVRERVQTENEGAYAELRIRDRVRQELWLRLGPAAESRDRYRVGDRVRARIFDAAPGEPAPVRTITNLRTRERDRIRSRDGSMLSTEERARDRERQRVKTEDRERAGEGGRPGGGDRPGAGDRPGGTDRPGGGRPGGSPDPGGPMTGGA